MKREELLKTLEHLAPAMSGDDRLTFREDGVWAFNGKAIGKAPPIEGVEGTVFGGLLLKLLQRLKTENITVLNKSEEVVIRGGRLSGGLNKIMDMILPDESDLEIPSEKELIPVHDEFVDILCATAQVASTDVNKGVLTTVHVTKTYVEACDNFRAIRWKTKGGWKSKPALIPASFLKEIAPLSEEIEKYYVGKKWMYFSFSDGVLLGTNVIKGMKYPDMDAFLSFDENEGTVITFPEEIGEVLDRASLFLDKDVSSFVQVTCKKGGESMSVEGRGPRGWFREHIRLKKDEDRAKLEEDVSFSVNPALLKRVLGKTGGEGVLLEGRIVFVSDDFRSLIATTSLGND